MSVAAGGADQRSFDRRGPPHRRSPFVNGIMVGLRSASGSKGVALAMTRA
jgi:hypothetical protein